VNLASKPLLFGLDNQTDEIAYVARRSFVRKTRGQALPPFSSNLRRSFLLIISSIPFS
jgi:hypothetical protein